MQYRTKEINGKVVRASAVYNEIDYKKSCNTIVVAIGSSFLDLQQSIKQKLKRKIAALTEDKIIVLNKDQENEVTFGMEKEFSNYDAEDSEFITITRFVISKYTKRRLVTSTKKIRNIKFVDNPECEFCYQKATKLFEAHLLDTAKTKKMVCAKCKKDIKIMAKINEKIMAKKAAAQ